MKIINIVIVDKYELYLESLASYISMYGSENFHTSCFTNMSGLLDYLTGMERKVDILLISSDFYGKEIPLDKVHTVIWLTSSNISFGAEDTHYINKYQNVNIIQRKIIDFFAEDNNESLPIVCGERKTKLVAVYSSMGGAGKTSIALSAGIQASIIGKSVLYLNLESIQSTRVFLKTDSEKSLSDILFNLKDENTMLWAQLEAMRCIDKESKLYYFQPPYRLMELEEISADEIKSFILELKALGGYDFIFIDMSSNFNSFNIEIMESCDNIFFICLQDIVSEYKEKIVLQEMKFLKEKKGYSLCDKLTLILNKYKYINEFKQENLRYKNMITLPYIEQATVVDSKEGLYNIDSSLKKEVGLMLEKIFSEDGF